jgi:hypothetical protein
MKVLAKDAKAGQWYKSRDYGIMLCCNGLSFWTPITETVDLGERDELTHLPDCTGWDWQPPKPEKKYRPFANAAEFMPHRGRWVKSELEDFSSAIVSCTDRAVWLGSATIGTSYGEMCKDFTFADDGTPFGVEVQE